MDLSYIWTAEAVEEAQSAAAPKDPYYQQDRHLLAEAMQQRDSEESVEAIEAPGRPTAPLPASISATGSPRPEPPPRPVTPVTHVLAPERPLKLFRLQDFEFLKILGTGTFGRVQLVKYRSSSVEKYFAMKILRKTEVVRLKQVDHVFSERSLLGRICFPFIVKLYKLAVLRFVSLFRFATFQDQEHIYMLLEYAIGGELFSYLRRAGRFGTNMAKFYAAEIVLALEYLHAHNVVYRDLKPENLLLDACGHMKIADFGFAKIVPEVTWTLCGTPEYLAPEIIQNRGHGKPADWWSLGVLIFEMIAGYPPFYADTPVAIYEKIVKGVLEFPRHFDPVAKDLVCRLLSPDPCTRLGSVNPENGLGVRTHSWFLGVDWIALYNRTVPAPIVPVVTSPGDTHNFEEYPDESATGRGMIIPLTADIQNIFKKF